MPFHFLALELTLSHQMSGDHKTLIIYGLLLKSTIICRTDLTMTPGVSSFHRHAFGSAFHSLNSLQPLLAMLSEELADIPKSQCCSKRDPSCHCCCDCQQSLCPIVPEGVPGIPHAYYLVFPMASKSGSYWHHYLQLIGEETKVQCS